MRGGSGGSAAWRNRQQEAREVSSAPRRADAQDVRPSSEPSDRDSVLPSTATHLDLVEDAAARPATTDEEQEASALSEAVAKHERPAPTRPGDRDGVEASRSRDVRPCRDGLPRRRGHLRPNRMNRRRRRLDGDRRGRGCRRRSRRSAPVLSLLARRRSGSRRLESDDGRRPRRQWGDRRRLRNGDGDRRVRQRRWRRRHRRLRNRCGRGRRRLRRPHDYRGRSGCNSRDCDHRRKGEPDGAGGFPLLPPDETASSCG